MPTYLWPQKWVICVNLNICHIYSVFYIPNEVVRGKRAQVSAMKCRHRFSDWNLLFYKCIPLHSFISVGWESLYQKQEKIKYIAATLQPTQGLCDSLLLQYNCIHFYLIYIVPLPVSPTCCYGMWDGGTGCHPATEQDLTEHRTCLRKASLLAV